MVMTTTEALEMTAQEAADRLAAKNAEIADLRDALAYVKAERNHWHSLVPRADRVQFPFDIKGYNAARST